MRKIYLQKELLLTKKIQIFYIIIIFLSVFFFSSYCYVLDDIS